MRLDRLGELDRLDEHSEILVNADDQGSGPNDSSGR